MKLVWKSELNLSISCIFSNLQNQSVKLIPFCKSRATNDKYFSSKTCNHISLMHKVPKSHFFVFEPNYGGEYYLNSPFDIANSFCRCQVLSPLTITLDWNMQSYSLLMLIDMLMWYCYLNFYFSTARRCYNSCYNWMNNWINDEKWIIVLHTLANGKENEMLWF